MLGTRSLATLTRTYGVGVEAEAGDFAPGVEVGVAAGGLDMAAVGLHPIGTPGGRTLS